MDEKEQVLSKQDFLSVFADLMKSAGVVFLDGDKTRKSTNSYWELLRLVSTLMIVLPAAAGCKTSLSGIFSCNFTEVGKDPERRYLRPKLKFTSKLTDVFKNDSSKVYDTPYESVDQLKARVVDIMQELGGIKPLAGSSSTHEEGPQIIEV